MVRLTRRQLIGAAAGLVVVGGGAALPARGLTINPRESWATDRPPKGPMNNEDVRFLIVHHSASRNGHTGADAPAILRSFFDFHTTDRGWNDVAYNFLIDADGGIWEGRSGSLNGPVAGDATGGNQGFSQLVCIIGDYSSTHPSVASLTSLANLLAWLADRYGVSTAPGAQVSFTSRGSNLHPEGTSVTTPTITGHRTMSRTSCPGDILNAYVVGSLTADVEAIRGGSPPSPATTTSPSTSSTSSTTTTTTTVPATTTTVPATTTSIPATTTAVPASTSTSGQSPTSTTTATSAMSSSTTTIPAPTTSTLPLAVEPTSGVSSLLAGGIATAAALVLSGAGLLLWRQRRIGGD